MLKKTQDEIMKNWPKEYERPIVSIRCLAYNHEMFIESALNSFLTQETFFPFEIIVHDDASTDKTADIIRKYEMEYPKIIKPILETENQYSKKDNSLGRIVDSACKGKFIAFCEGDDFWIDSFKLQKQVDILEKFPNVSLVHSGFITVDEHGTNIFRPEFNEFMKESIQEKGIVSLFKGNHIMTLSIMIRRELLFDSSIFMNCPERWDYALFFAAAFEGNIKYIPKKMGAYRKVSTSITQSQPKRLYWGLYNVYRYYSKLLLIEKKKKIGKLSLIKCLIYILSNVITHKDIVFLTRIIKDKPIRIFIFPISFIHAFFYKIYWKLLSLRATGSAKCQ